MCNCGKTADAGAQPGHDAHAAPQAHGASHDHSAPAKAAATGDLHRPAASDHSQAGAAIDA